MVNAKAGSTADCNLTVVPMRGWSRDLTWSQSRTALDRHLAEYSSCNFPALLRGDRNRGELSGWIPAWAARRLSSNDASWDKRPRVFTRYLPSLDYARLKFRHFQKEGIVAVR